MKLFSFAIVLITFGIVAEIVERIVILEHPDLFWCLFGVIFGINTTFIIMC
jgi:hypothetical protein